MPAHGSQGDVLGKVTPGQNLFFISRISKSGIDYTKS